MPNFRIINKGLGLLKGLLNNAYHITLFGKLQLKTITLTIQSLLLKVITPDKTGATTEGFAHSLNFPSNYQLHIHRYVIL